ncbi:serrate RNA effector molecule homolog isoform X2 [Macrosteles quadrilineatus]|uniref:serrate RNA effector molecule homolog isoform X2 n=1 Tax=Macrosteles quadrilineatus TaxID=74068 RepID=UPI0023E151C1|nr:serrate RNA effector molecule homolog isoform X2 [Macrosteles quadrilineatus]
MGDSDDEYGDRKRRDKFRGERTESYRSGEGRREDRRRDDWIERDTWGGGRSRARGDYRGTVRERYSPARQHDFSPPPKRIRTEWDDRRMPYADTSYNYSASWGGQESQTPYTNNAQRAEQTETQPPMMSLKAFLQSQDDNISDEEAIRKYNEYKLEFRRQQLNEFFVAHKEEEWFKLKYHPEESIKRKQEQQDSLKKRVEVFMEFMESGRLDKVSVDADQSEQLIKLLDAAVIKLEGGNDFDLQILDEVVAPPAPVVQPSTEEENKAVIKKEPEEKQEVKEEASEEGEEGEKKTEENNEDKQTDDKSQGESSPPSSPKPKDESEEKKISSIDVDDTEAVSLNGGTEEEDDKPPKSPEETEKTKADDEMSVDDGECNDEKKTEESEEKIEKGTVETINEEKKEDDNSPKPRPLHRTASIFLRNLAPTITKQEVEGMCKRYPGFLRVAIADPQPERRWFRRGWVTFQRDVNIKEICWNLNNIRLRDCELGAIVNRDLSRRIRTVTGLTGHKQVLRHDLKLGAKIIHNLDAKTNLWQENKKHSQESFGLVSQNPVLRNITDYLIEEASAEEEELLGQASETEDNDERDQGLIKVLDRLLLYLRIVHSVDYYNHCEYPNEDEMPNRCGIMHARGSLPTTKVTSQEIQEYCRGFAQKMTCLINSCGDVEGQELTALGAKEAESEVEKFVAANTQELAKDKWLCPLSGKKFKGPEFVKKHIFNKHAEKIEEVKKEVEYFNNYLRDPKRPMLPEHPGNKAKKDPVPDHTAGPYFSYGGYGGGRGYQHYGGYPTGYSRPGRGGMFPRGGRMMRRHFGQHISHPYDPFSMPHQHWGVSDYRPVIHYRDLDAPREPDEFI